MIWDETHADGCCDCRLHYSQGRCNLEAFYIMQLPEAVKVGVSVAPCKRRAQLQREFGFPVQLLAATYKGWGVAQEIELAVLLNPEWRVAPWGTEARFCTFTDVVRFVEGFSP